jgi:tRNA pseudouridine13 synthase
MVFEREPDDSKEAREFISKNWGKGSSYLEALEKFPRRLAYERSMLDYLHKTPTDFAGALRKLPKRLRKMFLNAVQAWIFNKTIEKLPKKDIEIPLVYYDSKPDNKNEIDKIILDVLKEEEIDLKNFEMPSMPELKCTGGYRKLLLIPKDVKLLEITDDDINEKKLKFTISFSLPSGSYASVVMKEVMK